MTGEGRRTKTGRAERGQSKSAFGHLCILPTYGTWSKMGHILPRSETSPWIPSDHPLCVGDFIGSGHWLWPYPRLHQPLCLSLCLNQPDLLAPSCFFLLPKVCTCCSFHLECALPLPRPTICSDFSSILFSYGCFLDSPFMPKAQSSIPLR